MNDGNLDTDQVPRNTDGMTRREAQEIRRLKAEVNWLNEQLAKATDSCRPGPSKR